MLLPVVLSFAGGPGYALENADEEWMSTTVRRYDYEYVRGLWITHLTIANYFIDPSSLKTMHLYEVIDKRDVS